jgi:hypothetical protein
MTIQQDIEKLMSQMHEERLKEQKEILRLGQLIKLLEELPQEENVRFDFCNFTPDDVMSYRGYYSDLAISYKENEEVKVSDLLNKLNSVRNTVQEGYKGGDYIMHDEVPVWVANYGKCHGTAVVGVKKADYGVIIETAHID